MALHSRDGKRLLEWIDILADPKTLKDRSVDLQALVDKENQVRADLRKVERQIQVRTNELNQREANLNNRTKELEGNEIKLKNDQQQWDAVKTQTEQQLKDKAQLLATMANEIEVRYADRTKVLDDLAVHHAIWEGRLKDWNDELNKRTVELDALKGQMEARFKILDKREADYRQSVLALANIAAVHQVRNS